MKLKSHKMTSSQGQILEVFQTISSGSGGVEGANGWHYRVIRSQMGGSISDPEASTHKLNVDGRINLQKCSLFSYFTSK